MNRTLTILVPTFNEIEGIEDCFYSIEELLEMVEMRLPSLDVSVLFVDNYSSDGTWQKIKSKVLGSKNWGALRLVRNYGVQASLLRGMSVISSDGLLVLQSDMQDPIEIALLLIQKWEVGNRVVVGITESRSENLFDRWTRALFYRILSKTSNSILRPWVHDFYVLDKQVYSELYINGYKHEFIRGRIAEEFGIDDSVIYKRKLRLKGESSFNFHRKHSMALDGVLRFGSKLARIISNTAMVISIFTFTIIIFLISSWIFGYGSALQGWLSLAAIGLINLSFLSFLVTLILEFQFRILRISHSRAVPTILENVGIEIRDIPRNK